MCTIEPQAGNVTLVGGPGREFEVNGVNYPLPDEDAAVTGTVPDTGGWDKFRTGQLESVLQVPAGQHVLRVTPRTMPHGAVMNLSRITLRPE